MHMVPWKLVWITGASSGIGREIAAQLAAQGVQVAASARSAEKLSDLGTNVCPYPCDVIDQVSVADTFAKIERELGPVDLALFCAGTFAPVEIDNIDPLVFQKTIMTNYMGVVNCLAAALPSMLSRSKGHIAWIASVAGYSGLPKSAAYGSSKAALINLAESLRPELELRGIKISVVNPGFVQTPMTAPNDFPMPFIIRPEEAARRTIEGLATGRFETTYPKRLAIALKIARLLPYWLYFWLIKRTVLKQTSAQ